MVTALVIAMATQAGRLDLELRPRRAAGGEVSAISVTAEFGAGPGRAKPFSLTAPITYAGVPGIADWVEALEVRDRTGPVPLRIDDDPPAPGGFPYFRHWRAVRPVTDPVSYSYPARVAPPGGQNGPPFAIRAIAGGVSGAGSGFLVVPEDTIPVVSRVRWALNELGPGSVGITSFGEGSFEHQGPPEELLQAWYMAGPVDRFPAVGDLNGFSAAWLGTPPFDPERELDWAGRLYGYLGAAFGYLTPSPRYRVFMRFLADPPYGGGTALPGSFMFSRGPKAAAADTIGPRETFAHEMIHQWVGQLDEPQGIASWFSEGLTTYYTLELPFRGGFDSPAGHAEAIADLIRSYQSNPGRTLSADSIARIGFGDEAIRHAPYQRGALYFADLAARIRAASNGRRTLDDVLRGLFERRARGEPIGRAAFLDAVAKELGPSTGARFEAAILRGEPIEPPLRIATTHHRGRFNGQEVSYTAIVAEALVKDSAGTSQGAVVTTSYLRDSVDRTDRPVIFLFNGGPGASSTPLHFAGFGPVRRVGEGSAQRMVPNPDSPLDTADLVFIDPIGTGYSRPWPNGKAFWSRSGDAASVRAVIQAWLARHQRNGSPVYLCGESYGTTRVAAILRQSGGLRVDGVLLFSLVGNPAGQELPYVVTLPAFAATAWYHERIPRRGRTVEQVYRDAVEFARTEYVTALIKGSSVSPLERRRVADRMSGLIGLPASLIEANDLRVTEDSFMLNVLKSAGLRTGQLDGRATARLDAPKRRPPYDDPGLNFVPRSVGSGPAPSGLFSPPADPSMASGAAPASPPALETYFRTTLGFPADDRYIALNLDVNAAWDHEGMTDINAAIGAAMAQAPAMWAFWAGGYFDISTPVYGARYALDHAGVPADRLTAILIPAGHTVFTEPANRTRVAEAVRAFVRPTPVSRRPPHPPGARR